MNPRLEKESKLRLSNALKVGPPYVRLNLFSLEIQFGNIKWNFLANLLTKLSKLRFDGTLRFLSNPVKPFGAYRLITLTDLKKK